MVVSLVPWTTHSGRWRLTTPQIDKTNKQTNKKKPTIRLSVLPQIKIRGWDSHCAATSDAWKKWHLSEDQKDQHLQRTERKCSRWREQLVCAWVLSCVWFFVTLQTAVRQPPLSMRFPRQEYWAGCHFLLQGIANAKTLWSTQKEDPSRRRS